MGRSMWSCSGQHWLRATAAWLAFAFFFAIAIELSGDATAETINVAPGPAVTANDLRTEPPTRRLSSVVVNVSTLDLAQLDTSAFGDHE